MKLGLHINDFTWPGGPSEIGPKLAEIAQTAERVGYDRISVMDHVWQIHINGPKEHEMLEGYTALGFIAAHTSRVQLLTLVTGVTYRAPGLLAKAVTTLDVLSSGRAWLGIGAAWNEAEALGLGLNYAPTSIRFEQLEEAVQICLQMWSDNDGSYDGHHFQLASTLNSPQPLSRPRPRIMIGGAGEKKTLRLVAKYADACNISYFQEPARRLQVLREHCERESRDYDSIEKTALLPMQVDGEGGTDAILTKIRELNDLGFTAVHGAVKNVAEPGTLETIGSEVIAEVSKW
jgi:F420-dependent oxidoreductase-like protein